VLDLKERPEGRYAICDGGRTNHALAADHHLHPIRLMPARGGPVRLTTICGPTCMTDDRLGRWLLPESLRVGDVILWMNAGAYHLPWETRFSHGLGPIVWCDEEERITVARQRERVEECAHQ
jgi:diaminopimelate decarboxylase